MDEFLHELREQPRPAFAKTLARRLAERERAARRRAQMLFQAGGLAALAFGLALFVNLHPGHSPAEPPAEHIQQTVLLTPASQLPANLSGVALENPAAPGLYVSAKPISHHHEQPKT